MVIKRTIESIENWIKYEAFITMGLLIAGLSLVKVLGYYDFSSDWLWFLAGVGLMVEGIISLNKQRRFDKKYKIIERKG
jgi:hypothetical protein